MHGQVGLRTHLPDVVGEGGSEPVRRGHVAAQVEDRQPQVGHHAGQLAAEVTQALRHVGVTGRGGHVVDHVAERGHLLGDPVVDLAGQPLPFVGRGHGADLVEDEGGVEPQAVRVDLIHQRGHRLPVGRARRRRDCDADHPVADSQGQHEPVPGVAVAGRHHSLHRLHLGPALLDHRVVGDQDLLGADPAVPQGHQDGPLHVHEDGAVAVVQMLVQQRHQLGRHAVGVQAGGQPSGDVAELGEQLASRLVVAVLVAVSLGDAEAAGPDAEEAAAEVGQQPGRETDDAFAGVHEAGGCERYDDHRSYLGEHRDQHAGESPEQARQQGQHDQVGHQDDRRREGQRHHDADEERLRGQGDERGAARWRRRRRPTWPRSLRPR